MEGKEKGKENPLVWEGFTQVINVKFLNRKLWQKDQLGKGTKHPIRLLKLVEKFHQYFKNKNKVQ